MLSAPVEGDAIVEEYARNGGGSVALEVKAGREFHVLVSYTVGAGSLYHNNQVSKPRTTG